MHPKQLEHESRQRLQRENERINHERELELKARHRLRWVHMRHRNELAEVVNKGGMTLAYQLPLKGRGDVIKVAAALTNRSDAYCKRVGRQMAAEHFDEGHFIHLRVPRNMAASHFLKQTFYIAA